jgi:hypothetical protein
VHLTALELQQSPAVVQEPPSPVQATLPISTQTPFWQKPEQQSKPLVHAPVPASDPTGAPVSAPVDIPASAAAAAPGVAMHAESVQNPRMFGVSSCPSR